jgi:hypothetical protein
MGHSRPKKFVRKTMFGRIGEQMATQSGSQAQLRVVTEEIYTTEYDAQETAVIVPENIDPERMLCFPSSFRTREVGAF